MKTALPLFLLTLAAPCYAAAEHTAAEAAVRNANPAEALKLLQNAEDSPQTHYWRGRALVDLQRYAEAFEELQRVPAENELRPYAGMTAVYCARRMSNAEEVLEQLCADTNKGIAAAANAALQEQLIRRNRGGNVSSIDMELAKEAAIIPEGKALLEAVQLRKKGQYAAALELCRKAEDADSPRVREYSRLVFAEIYYAMEQQAPESGAEGKGEETLLKFISSFPESPLLTEAFRRLEYHRAFSDSKYAAQKLEEWSTDITATYRALLATAMLQKIQLDLYNETEQAELLTNRAITINPDFVPLTVHISNELVRTFIARHKVEDAEQALARVPQNQWNAETYFLKAQTLPATNPQATELYLRSAELAAPTLREVALGNAIFCAYSSGDTATCDKLLAQKDTSAVRRSILLTHAALLLRKDIVTAANELNEVLQLNPPPQQKIEAILLLTQIDLENGDYSKAMERLGGFTHAQRTTWTNDQVMRYYGLYLHALDCEYEQQETETTHKDFLRQALQLTKRTDVREAITLKLAKIYSDEGDHTQALQMLTELCAHTDDKEMRARLLLLAGREATQQASRTGLMKGAELFGQVSRTESVYKHKAALLESAVLLRLNRVEEASQVLNRALKKIESERSATPGSTYLSEEYAFALSVQADIAAIPGNKESLLRAIECNEKIFTIPGLTTVWHIRARLQQGVFCSRAGLYEKALFNYSNIVTLLPKNEEKATPANFHLLSLAGTGAIAALLKLERWDDAATMAEQIVAHPISQRYSQKTRHFVEWAQQIRLYHPTNASARR